MTHFISQFAKNYWRVDKYFLVNKPWIWETKVHLAFSLSAIISLFAVLIAFVYPDDIIRVNLFGFTTSPFILASSIIVSTIGMGYWFWQHISFQGDIANVKLNNNTYRKQFSIYLSSILLFMMPTVLVLVVGFMKLEAPHFTLIKSEELYDLQLQAFFSPLIYVLGAAVLAVMLLQMVKSLGWKKLTPMLSISTLLITFLAMISEFNSTLSLSIIAIVIIGTVLCVTHELIITNKMFFSEEFTSRIAQFKLYPIFLIHLFTPIACWMIWYIPILLILIQFHQPIHSIGWIIGPLGTSLYIYFFIPKYQFYYLKLRQHPQ